MSIISHIGIEDLGPYKVHSRREVLLLLRGIQSTNEPIRMVFNNGSEVVITAILEIDEAEDRVVIDAAPMQEQTDRAVSSDNISFETALDRIRVLFFTTRVTNCIHKGKPALRFALPSSMIRVQRREFYRVRTPRTPVRVPIPAEEGRNEITVYMRDISAGGISILDEEAALDTTVGQVYEDCRITLSDKSIIIADLEVRNAYEIRQANGKLARILGVQFYALPNQTRMLLQRYITRIEREQNAKTLNR